MAELAIATTLGVLQIVVPLLRNINEKERPDPESLGRTLRSLNSFIEDHDGCEGGKTLEEHMKEARDIAYEIEDVLDEFILHCQPYFFHRHNFSRYVHHKAHQIRYNFPLSGISGKFDRITKRIGRVESKLQAFPVKSTARTSSTSNVPYKESPLLIEKDMVGYEVERKALIDLLTNGDQSLVRVAVVGACGSGKTTLVSNVFEDSQIKEHFECHAWLHLGKRYDIDNLLVNLLKKLGLWDNRYTYDHDSCLRELRKYVANKRFLLVLDDIWVEADRIWNYIEKAILNTSKGNRIIITTRVNAPSHMKQFVVQLKGLEFPEGMNLFCKKAFWDRDNDAHCPPNLEDWDAQFPPSLEEWAVQIVKRCEQQPFAIVAVGEALARKQKDQNEWKRFHKSFECGSWKDSFHLKVILKTLLSDYSDLDINLKRCFLYFSILTEDYSIRRRRLIRLWVAEGFAMGNDDRTAEEVADDYLNQLIQRHLVHVTDTDSVGRPRNCRVLNLILMFIVRKCKDENFISIFNEENPRHSEKIRRLAVHHNYNGHDFLPESDFSGVRSIFLTRLLGRSESEFNNHLGKMKLLRVFDFQNAPLTEFPKGIIDLTLIRHLCFEGTKIKTIPSSIEKLSYLETLDLKQTEVTELPKEIAHLHNLCHLFVYNYSIQNYVVFGSVKGVRMHGGIENLTRLQNLSLIKVDRKGKLLEELKELKEMRKLGVTDLRTRHGKDLCAAVEKMQHLRTLDVCTISMEAEEYLELGNMRNGPSESLQRLYLKGRLRKLPTWISSLGNLRKVALKWSKLEDNPLEGLKCLQNLLDLQLVDCYIGGDLIFPASCFKMLKILTIEDMEKLHTIVIQDGAMPDLQKMSLLKCRQVKICPSGIKKLGKIQELNLYDMDQELLARIGKKGRDYAMVKHIPEVLCWALNSNGSFEKISGT